MTFRPLILTAEILLSIGWLQAQATVPLKVVEQHKLTTVEDFFKGVATVQCDASGNMYFFSYYDQMIYRPVLHRLSPVSPQEKIITLDPAFKGGVVSHVVVEPDGTLYELINSDSEPYNRVAKLDKAGKVVAAVELKNSECVFGEMTAIQFGVFASGNFFVAGETVPSPLHLKPFAPGDTGHAPQCGMHGSSRPFLAVFGADGTFVAEVYHGSASQSDEEKAKHKLLFGSEGSKDALQMGRSAIASAGDSVYFIAPDSTELLTISPSGSIVSAIPLHPPTGYTPFSVHVKGTSAMVEFVVNNRPLYQYVIYDLKSGQVRTRYSGQGLGYSACFNKIDDFTFLEQRQHYMVINHVTP